MAIFDNFPYTNFHELNLDWVLKEVKDTAEQVALIDPKIHQAVADYLDDNQSVQDAIDQALANGIEHIHAENHTNIYIAGTTGDDDNTGLDIATPVKTLERAFDIMNRQRAICWFYIIEPGSYYITTANIGSCTFHLSALTTNVTIYWLTDPLNTTLKTFYDSYVHLEGFSDGTTIFHISGTGVDRAYMEAGKMFAHLITFESDGTCFGIVGAMGTFSECTFKTKLKIRQGCFNIGDCKFQQVDNENSGDAFLSIGYCSVATISAGAEFIDIDDSTTPALVSTDRSVVFLTVTPTVTNPVGTPLYLDAVRSIINGRPTQTRAWINNVGRVEMCSVLGLRYENQTTNNVGYDSVLINAATEPGATRYDIDPNAKSLTLNMSLIDSDGTTVLIRSIQNIDLRFNDWSTLLEMYVPPIIYTGALTGNVMTALFCRFNLYTNKQIRYLHSYGVPLTTGTGANVDVYSIKIDIYQNF